MSIIQAEPVFPTNNIFIPEVELIEIKKIKIILFNKETGEKFIHYIIENEWWYLNKHLYQNNFTSLFNSIKYAFEKINDFDFNINILNDDLIELYIKYTNLLLGFNITLQIQKSKSDDKYNLLEYQFNKLKDKYNDTNKELSNVYNELNEIKRSINLLGDCLNQKPCKHSENNEFNKYQHYVTETIWFYLPMQKHGDNDNRACEPFLNETIFKKLENPVFLEIIKQNNIKYDFDLNGINWEILMTSLDGGRIGLSGKGLSECYIEYIKKHYDYTWDSFKKIHELNI